MMFPCEPIRCVTIGNMRFNDWILLQLQERDWSQAELARLSGLTRSAISKYLNDRIPDQDALRKIAKAFNLPPETVFRAANVLPTTTEDPWVEEMDYKISQLTGTNREIAERFLNSLLDTQARGSQTQPKTALK